MAIKLNSLSAKQAKTILSHKELTSKASIDDIRALTSKASIDDIRA